MDSTGWENRHKGDIKNCPACPDFESKMAHRLVADIEHAYDTRGDSFDYSTDQLADILHKFVYGEQLPNWLTRDLV